MLTLPEKLQKIFEIEKRRNFDNCSIKPSFSTSMVSLLSKIPSSFLSEKIKNKIEDITALLKKYEKETSSKKNILEETENLILTLQEHFDRFLSSPIQYLKGVGPQRARVLQKIQIEKVEDLILYFPRDWED